MKVFDRDDKINFVDDNNVFIGYSTDSKCCESFGWFISGLSSITEKPEETEINGKLDEWCFDTSFFSEYNSKECVDYDRYLSMAIFKIDKDGESKYLYLYNIHNGYYTHGFEFKDGDKIIKNKEI